MFSFGVKALQNGFGSPRNNVSGSGSPTSPMGEIDTRAPFESVKAAVSLFGDVGSPRARPMTKKTKAEEQRLLEREAQYHMTIRELDYYRDQLKRTESAKEQALKDMERANTTLLELTNKLETIAESKQAAITAADAAETRAKQLEEQKAQLGNDSWKVDVDAERELYKATSGKLIATKQELTNLRQDFDAALETKLRAFQQSEDSLQAEKVSREVESDLLEQASVLRQKLDQVKSTSYKAEEEHLKLVAEKEVHFLVYKSAKQSADMELNKLKQEYVPEDDPTQKLEEVTEAIKILQEQLVDVRASDFNSLNSVVLELSSIKNELQEVVAEEDSARNLVDSLKWQLEDLTRGRFEWENRAVYTESRLEQMQSELDNKKAELELAMSGNAFEDMKSNLAKMTSEAAEKKQEKEDIMKDVESVTQEAESARLSAKEAEEKLQITLKEAKEAEAAKKLADDQIHNSPKVDDANTTGGSSRKIRLSAEEFQLMHHRIEELKKQADEEVTTLENHMKTVRESEKEVQQKVDSMSKEIENLVQEIEDAVKRVEMAEAAKKIVEGELQKWSKNGNGEESSRASEEEE